MSQPAIRRFSAADYPALAIVPAAGEEELRGRDDRRGAPLLRWVASSADVVIAAATAMERPDQRLFVQFVGDKSAYGRLAEYMEGELRCPLHATADDDQALAALRGAGFRTEMVFERFEVSFDAALAALPRSWTPSWVEIVGADETDEDRLFTLDNELRQDVPGTDGWLGNRRWFHEELSESPPFDAGGYQVAIDVRNGEHIGLARMWRNPEAPRFGLIGTRPSYRTTTIAGALVRQVLVAASQWGHETFMTEASVGNQAIYPRLVKLGATRLGRTHQLKME